MESEKFNIKPKYITLFLIAVLLNFLITSCTNDIKNSKIDTTEVITEEKEAISEKSEIAKEESADEPEELKEPEIDINKVKFWEAITEGEKCYDISDKVLDYPFEEMEILSNFIDGKITYDEQIIKFWDLANRVQDDFFLVEIMIGGRLKERGIEEPDKEMQEIINLIVEWADKTEKTYSYYAKFLETDQAEYDFKVDELKEETKDIHSKYLELRHPYIIEYNKYYDIE